MRNKNCGKAISIKKIKKTNNQKNIINRRKNQASNTEQEKILLQTEI